MQKKLDYQIHSNFGTTRDNDSAEVTNWRQWQKFQIFNSFLFSMYMAVLYL